MPPGFTLEKIPAGATRGLRVYTPPGGGSGAGVLWIHGGGMVIGSASQDDVTCLELAAEQNAVVVSAEYRLAPQHPYPAPLDDCLDAWTWLLDHAAERGVDSARLAVGGQSAGGGLAAGLVQRIHDAGGPQPAAQLLFCPMLDDRTISRRELDTVRHRLWDNRANRVGWTAYLGSAVAGPDVPGYAAPVRRTDLSGLPPAWIGVGDIDLFYEEDRAYAAALEAAGVPCTLDVVHGGPHAFESLVREAPVSQAYRRRAHDWLKPLLRAS